MTKTKPRKHLIAYFTKNISAIIGIVLIWRGIWYLLDVLEQWISGNSHWLTAFVSVVISVLILYLSDRDLSEIERL